MNAIGRVDQLGEVVPERRDWLRVAGGMMFGAGALVLLIRKGGEWGDWANFFALAIPAAILFGVVLVGRARDGLSGWHVAFLVFGTLLLLGALIEFVNAVNGNPRASLNVAWTFGLSAAIAIFTSLAWRAQFQMLLGGLLTIVAWLFFWDKVLSNPSGDTARWLLIVLAAIFLAAGVALTRARLPQASDLITVAGITAVLAAALSFAGAAAALNNTVGSSLSGNVPKPGQGWNIFLLVVSLLLIAYESRSPTRGPGYVGAIGLLGFIGLTGVDLVNRLNGETGGGVVGWPLVLLIGGGAALAASFVLKPGALGGPGGGAAAGPGGPGAGAYAQPGAPAYGQPPAPPPWQPPAPGYGQPPPPPPPGAGPPPPPQ